MGSISDAVGSILVSIMLLILAILAFFLTVFVISNGAALAGYSPDGNFVVLSATILVSASILSGVWQEA